MLGLILIGLACFVLYRVAEMDRRNPVVWLSVGLGLGVVTSVLLGTLLASLATLVLGLGAMFVARTLAR